ncbi:MULTISPECIES: HYC_CC_PP family protein [Pedobacter]|uniref:HYC_CC_PP family protein n=1 Tax=Pedobacter TaxID=84567 RepID=UPI0021092123|nr:MULTISPECIES: hypothetical protein [unclassified Pedobacter]
MKLQRKIALGLCVFYLFSVIGIAVSMHFCNGSFSSFSFTKAAKCGSCKATGTDAKSHDCCKTTDVDAKVEDSHEASGKISIPKIVSLEMLFDAVLPYFKVGGLAVVFKDAEGKAPPLSSLVRLHLFNCVFRN